MTREGPLPRLGRAYLDTVESGAIPAPRDVLLPPAGASTFPERVLQFGTGAFLRGFVEYFVDEANRRGDFAGRIVAVSSTGTGRDRVLDDQDGLFTLSARGVVGGTTQEEHRVVSSLSRALSAQRDWKEVLACARTPELELIVSNTTEVGIVFDETDTFDAAPPKSFPGKLTRVLYERARAFAFSRDHGVTVLPCELIENNGDVLRDIVYRLAHLWKLPSEFVRWLNETARFCNTLVDRIVPGAPTAAEAETLRDRFGYDDRMTTTCEWYRLFAIDGDDALRARLPFANVEGVVVASDIRPYRERKVRLLNGAHTIMVPVALLCGCETVRQAAEHPLVGAFLRRVLFDELVATVDVPDAETFARDVLDRFANPFIHHALVDITLQGTMKMRVRVVPSIVRAAELEEHPAASLSFGFAAFLYFMRGDLQARRRSAGLSVPADDRADHLRALWAEHEAAGEHRLVAAACADTSLWDRDLAKIPGFVEAVASHLSRMRSAGVECALDSHLAFIGSPMTARESELSSRTT